MKKTLIFLALMLVGVGAKAAPVWAIVTSTFTHDATEGTFVVGNSTYGYVTAVKFNLNMTDSPHACSAQGNAEFAVPRATFPAAVVVRALITRNVVESGMRAQLLRCVAAKAALQQAILNSGVNGNVPGVDGTTISP